MKRSRGRNPSRVIRLHEHLPPAGRGHRGRAACGSPDTTRLHGGTRRTAHAGARVAVKLDATRNSVRHGTASLRFRTLLLRLSMEHSAGHSRAASWLPVWTNGSSQCDSTPAEALLLVLASRSLRARPTRARLGGDASVQTRDLKRSARASLQQRQRGAHEPRRAPGVVPWGVGGVQSGGCKLSATEPNRERFKPLQSAESKRVRLHRSGWGPGGRRFKSCLPDRIKALLISMLYRSAAALGREQTGNKFDRIRPRPGPGIWL